MLTILACSDKITVLEPQVNYKNVTDLSQYNMKIIPESQGSSDNIRLVVYEDCQYNILTGVTKNGNTIEIEKHFNSMMKLACMLRNDTIPIGKLPEGTYRVNYKLMDLSTYVKDPVAMAIAFNMMIVK
jgi:hypothetical protein